jgi:hypothetical protein
MIDPYMLAETDKQEPQKSKDQELQKKKDLFTASGVSHTIMNIREQLVRE